MNTSVKSSAAPRPPANEDGLLGAALQGAARVSRWLARIGGAMMLVCAILVSLDVVVRAAFKVTYFESFELSTYAFAIATALGLSYALVSRAHIRIEVLYMLLPARRRGWVDLFAYVVLAVCALTLLYWSAQLVLGNYQSGARSNSSLSLPLVIPQGIWLIGLAWFALLSVLYALLGLRLCLRGRPEQAHRQLGVASLEEEIEANMSRKSSP